MLKLHDEPLKYEDMDYLVTFSWFCNRRWTTQVYAPYYSENQIVTGIEIKTNKTNDFEFLYQFHFIPDACGQKSTVVRGIGEYRERYCFLKFETLSSESCNLSKHYDYTQMNFQAVIFVIIGKGKFRRFNFFDKDVYGKSVGGKPLHVPIVITKARAPLLFKVFEENEMKTNTREDLRRFLQILYGARMKLKKEETERFLRMAKIYKVLTVKKYCEQNMIWRKNLGFSEEEKCKLACKYNLNILMNQLLRDVNTVEELAELSSIAIGVKSVEPNIFKLMIAKMYRDF